MAKRKCVGVRSHRIDGASILKDQFKAVGEKSDEEGGTKLSRGQ